MMNGAETLVKTLLASGVNVCFANPGTSEMHFVAALDCNPEMRCILCLFEGGATGAADGYFRMSSEVAATLLHLAPGFGNGVANLHNARKAQSGIVNIMGDHASYHLRYESPLRGDTVGISETVSHWTRVSDDAGSVAGDGAAAIRAARSSNGQIATLILPANTAWEEAGESKMSDAAPSLRRPEAARVAAAARALCSPGAALLVDGQALRGELSLLAARIAKKSGCRLMAPYLVARIQRGGGSVRLQRLAYRIDDNVAHLADKTNLVLCGAVRPTSFFAYPDKVILPENSDCRVIDLCSIDMDYAWTLEALAEALGARNVELGPEDFQPLNLPPVPTGAMSIDKVGQAIAALMPANAIVVNEGNSSARAMDVATESARLHDMLMITGGSIGFGLPVAVGAAVACPDRKVLALEGDGSAMYTLQSLWTMARENLDVTVVVFANRRYQILRIELANVGVTHVGRNAERMFDLVEPTLDWVALARGHGVEGVRVIDVDQFAVAFRGAMEKKGPLLIEVVC
ncbi:acetolactate synthase large subunit [Nordella sp. HKS 07]|nr:acetolactate synthase large subunit [Nordella sp. HKS 07]